ncbi:hypothetical protein [Marinobacterium weihaiense]|uniref:Uncharacterized protein n=1 Tax=Marinobacterium weihaiense TaxID=2851016 RepID=A0ABS6M7I4_9GAMM|nr:hypothetical protein [Marinobacterium weihaiense]MBV0932241.1 hypothetical protein [Marinobacterium weihaiense]
MLDILLAVTLLTASTLAAGILMLYATRTSRSDAEPIRVRVDSHHPRRRR